MKSSKDFWALVNKTSPSECWEWRGKTDKNKYGRYWNGKSRVHAHRFSYQEKFGRLSSELYLKHLCGNSLCVNPDHLQSFYIDDRFWGKVSKISRTTKENCWEWLAYADKNGYGNFWFDGKNHQSHRIAWMLTFGDIPDGMCVCHMCDNPSCVNPYHLFLGTSNDNTQDKMDKGRHVKSLGERHGNHKLNKQQVIEIKQKLKKKIKQKELAKEYKVSCGTISLIKSRKTWSWADENCDDCTYSK